MNVKHDLHTFVWSYRAQIVFNVHNPVKLKILTVNPYLNVLLYCLSIMQNWAHLLDSNNMSNIFVFV